MNTKQDLINRIEKLTAEQITTLVNLLAQPNESGRVVQSEQAFLKTSA